MLGIECDAMRIGQTRGVALQQSKRGVILSGILLEHDHSAVVLRVRNISCVASSTATPNVPWACSVPASAACSL